MPARPGGLGRGGGLALYPRRQGVRTAAAVQLLPGRRDDSDRLLVRQILELQMQVLGVGLGMQQLNVALGGTLFLHLPEERRAQRGCTTRDSGMVAWPRQRHGRVAATAACACG